MRPQRRPRRTPEADLGELVCSNSLRSDLLSAPAGLTQSRDAPARLRHDDSLSPSRTACPRVQHWRWIAMHFARGLTASDRSDCRDVRIIREEVREIPDEGIVIRCHRAADVAGAIASIDCGLRRGASVFLRCDFAHRDCRFHRYGACVPSLTIRQRR